MYGMNYSLIRILSLVSQISFCSAFPLNTTLSACPLIFFFFKMPSFHFAHASWAILSTSETSFLLSDLHAPCPPGVSTWVCHRHLKLNMSKRHRSFSYPTSAPPLKWCLVERHHHLCSRPSRGHSGPPSSSFPHPLSCQRGHLTVSAGSLFSPVSTAPIPSSSQVPCIPAVMTLQQRLRWFNPLAPFVLLPF